MTARRQKNHSYAQAAILPCSESALCRRLLKDGIRPGVTKLKHRYTIAHTRIKASGAPPVMNASNEVSQPVTIRQENTRVRVNNVGGGLQRLLSEREKVVALPEQTSRREPFWSGFTHRHENKVERYELLVDI